MKILSLYWGTCSTAALMIDGRIAGCVSEERFTRIKNEDSYPFNAIEKLLEMTGTQPDELDFVVYAGERFDALAVLTHKYSKFSSMDRLREQKEYWYPKLYENKEMSYLDVFQDKIDTNQYPGKWEDIITLLKSNHTDLNAYLKEFRKNTIVGHLGIDRKKVIFTDHHRAHGYYSYYASPMEKDKTVILTAEAWGDDKNASVCLAKGSDIEVLASSGDFILGRLYRNITLLLGMKPDEHEYKIMGLAAYAKPRYYNDALSIFENTMYVDGLNFSYHHRPKDLFYFFKDNLEGYRFDSIAGGIQKYAENILVQWARNALQTTGARKLVFGGGVAMNIKAMMEISKLPELDEIFICPSPSDESLAIGSAYAVAHDMCKANHRDPVEYLHPLEDAYLGPGAMQEDIDRILDEAHVKGYEVYNDPEFIRTAKLIVDGKIVGRCAGKSEFGARALGNRSILADPRDLKTVKIINEKIKSRDFWMPFAPSILEERAGEYLLMNGKIKKAPYMTVGFNTTNKAWTDLRAALHQADMTARPQIVSRQTNPEYHKVITEFSRISGVAGVLNTSFNVHGEPIVQTPADAFDVFERTELDALLLDTHLVTRKN